MLLVILLPVSGNNWSKKLRKEREKEIQSPKTCCPTNVSNNWAKKSFFSLSYLEPYSTNFTEILSLQGGQEQWLGKCLEPWKHTAGASIRSQVTQGTMSCNLHAHSRSQCCLLNTGAHTAVAEYCYIMFYNMFYGHWCLGNTIPQHTISQHLQNSLKGRYSWGLCVARPLREATQQSWGGRRNP